MVLAVEASFVAAEGLQASWWMGQGLVGEHGRVADFHRIGLAVLLVDDAGGFEGPQAELTPAGDVHGFDEVVLVGGGGVELVDEGAAEFEKRSRDSPGSRMDLARRP